MTREEFIETIEGFEKCPFRITINGNSSSPLFFVKCLSDSVKVLSNGKPAIYKYDAIESLTFDEGNDVQSTPEMIPPKNLNQAPSVEAISIPTSLIEDAKRIIWLHDFSLIDRSSQFKEAIHGTTFEKEWSRIQNMIKDAQKNHALSEKIGTIISKIEQLPQNYDCIEYYIMYGEVLALDEDYANASLQFEIAGEYQNAAYYASKCEEKSNEYLLEILRKWIVSGKDYEKNVIASFLSLCYSMHRGRVCAETIAQVANKSINQDCQKIVRLGLILSLSNYILNENELASLNNNSIQDLLDRLLNESISEQYEPDIIKKLKHANQIEKSFNNTSTWEENVQTGYIIKAFSTHGYIGKEKSDNMGVKFNLYNIASKKITELIESSPQSIIGLKVVYRLNKGVESYYDTAENVEPAENLEEFIQKKGINIAVKAKVNTSKEKLALSSDGKTYYGYIIKYIKEMNIGFIYKEYDPTQNGVFFHFNELEEKLKPIANKILGLKVSCELADSPKGTGDKVAVRIHAAESINRYVTPQAMNDNANNTTMEVVDEAEIESMLKYRTPSAALQLFATTNRPLHALEVLERSRDSFTYDKYVKHKIQLLQRTRSSDNELISLLNYTISTSSDGAYIAHNLYFLGQVQYRCKLYSDVIATMTKLFKYKRFFKSPTQNTDSLFLISIAYYMLRDYVNADSYAKELLNLGAHIEEVNKILNRTFATEESIHDHVVDNEADYSLQFDSEVAITPYIEKLINSFSFGSISVRDVPSDFDPWLSDCNVDLANDYIQRLIRYYSRSEQKNNPNAAIAIAKIQKWLLQQSSEEEKEKIEEELRNNVSRALQIMSRNTLQQSGVDIRVNLFYRMQQYKMSIRAKKIELFNAYINAHFGSSWMNSLKPANNSALKGTNHLLMISDLLFLLSYMERSEVDDATEQIEKICGILASRTDSKDYIAAIHTILDTLNGSYVATDKMYSQIISGSKAFHTWLNNNKRTIRDKAESKHWDELSDTLERLDKTLLSEYECEYLEKVREIARYLIDIDKNAQTAMKQNVLNQSKNQLNELDEKLQEEPTFILYSLFDDVLSIMNNSVLSSLAEVMSHEPDIEPVGTLQMNLGLTDSKEFILPLEFRNHLPSVQARNLTLNIESVTGGVSIISSLPMAQNVDEGEKYSTSLAFRLDNSNVSQVDISIKVEYSFDAFTNYTNERRSCTKRFNYTVTFREVESIVNKYRQYAGKQTVRDKSMFFGRDTLIQKLYDAISITNSENSDVLNGGNGIVLYGQRRSGKTSILHHLKEKIINNMLNTIVVDFGSIALAISSIENSDELNEEEMDEEKIQRHNSDMTLQTMYYTIIHGVRAFIRMQNSAIYDKLKADIKSYEIENNEMFFPNSELFANAQNPQLIFNAFLDRFRSVARVDDLKQGFRIVIIIDEFTYFNTAIKSKKLPYNFMEILKGIVSDSFITMVIAGQDNMVEFMEQYMNEFSSFQREWVTFLEKDASFKMVTEPIGEDRIDPESAEKLYRFTAGSPYLLMLICCKLVDWMNENKIYKLASSLLDDFLSDKYMKDYEFKEDLLEPQYKDAGRIEWTEKIKLVLGLIARQNSKKVSSNVIPWAEFDDYAIIRDDMLKDRGVSPEEMHEILERLVKRQVIETQEGYLNRFRIKIPLCREWILRRGGSEYGNE